MKRQEWRFNTAANKLAMLLGGQGYRVGRIETVSEILKIAVKVYLLPPDIGLTQAAGVVASLPRDERTRRAAQTCGAVGLPNKKFNRLAKRRAKNAKRRAKAGKSFHEPVKQIVFNDQTISEFYDSWDWKRLRYDFIKEKNRKCQCCGAAPSDGIRIVVDHIKPIRRFWHLRLDSNNLQMMCDDCNMGKGSRDTTDWRDDNVVMFKAADYGE